MENLADPPSSEFSGTPCSDFFEKGVLAFSYSFPFSPRLFGHDEA